MAASDTVTVWFSAAGHWWVQMPDGTTVKASEVQLDDAITKYKADGFRELLPGGPRGIIVGKLVGMVGQEEG